MLWSRTVPEYIDRSDDVAWMLGCSLILLTIQVFILPQKRPRRLGKVSKEPISNPQTGLGLMESGMCSLKNEVQIP